MRFIERKDTIEMLRLAVTAREHAFLLGPPGTGKSALVEEFAAATGLRCFTALVSPMTSLEEVIGPIDIVSLRNNRFRRITEGFLPTAQIAFLDEVFKASAALLNALLRIMQERKFAFEPPHETCVPLVSLVGASNEIPSDSHLSAFYDRFTLHCQVSYVSDDSFKSLLTGQGDPIENGLHDTDTIDEVHVKPDLLEYIVQIRRDLRKEGIIPSDRRWVKGIRVIQASAALADRQEASERDLLALRFVLWSKPAEAKIVEQVLWNTCFPEVAEARNVVSEIESKFSSTDSTDLGAWTELVAHVKTAAESLVRKRQRTGLEELDPYIARLKELHGQILSERLGIKA